MQLRAVEQVRGGGVGGRGDGDQVQERVDRVGRVVADEVGGRIDQELGRQRASLVAEGQDDRGREVAAGAVARDGQPVGAAAVVGDGRRGRGPSSAASARR